MILCKHSPKVWRGWRSVESAKAGDISLFSADRRGMGAREWDSDEALGQLGCHTRPDPDARRDPRAGCKTAPRCLASRGRFVVDRSAIKTLVRGANHDIAKDTDSATPAKSSKSHGVGYFRSKKTAETHSSRVSAAPVFFCPLSSS